MRHKAPVEKSGYSQVRRGFLGRHKTPVTFALLIEASQSTRGSYESVDFRGLCRFKASQSTRRLATADLYDFLPDRRG